MPVPPKEQCSKYDGMYYIHTAIRRDFRDFHQVLEKIQVRSDMPRSHWHRHHFVKYARFHLQCVHTHHHVEDEV